MLYYSFTSIILLLHYSLTLRSRSYIESFSTKRPLINVYRGSKSSPPHFPLLHHLFSAHLGHPLGASGWPKPSALPAAHNLHKKLSAFAGRSAVPFSCAILKSVAIFENRWKCGTLASMIFFKQAFYSCFPHTHTENSEVPIKVDRCGSGSNTASIGEVTTFILCFYDENVFPKTFVQLSRSSPPCHESVAKATLPMSGQTRARLLLH